MNSNQQPMPGQQVVLVAQDSDTDLEALFNSVMNPKPSSWRKKLLPESFFKEPDSGSHSRQSSTDSTSHPPRLQVSHTRSHSSPASLQLGTVSSPSPGPQNHQHQRHQSFDVAEELPLPPGWEMAYTSNGQKYFLNHIEKITTWVDPRKSMAPNMTRMSLLHNAQNNATTLPQALTHTPSHNQSQCSMAPSQPNLGDLPAGWEQAVSPQGETYYIDHKTHSTSWLHPKLLMQQHRQHPQQHHHQQQQIQAQQVPVQTMGSPSTLAQQHSSAGGMMVVGGPLGAGASGVGGVTSVQGVGVTQQQKMRLQRIQLERERIQRRQEELMRQEVALCGQLPMEADSLASSLPPAGANQKNNSNMASAGSDPFLNSSHFHHSREQSTDSGLGLGCYSIPTTPEDFLNNMEEMDTGDSQAQGSLSMPTGQPSRFPDFLDSLPGTNVDLGTLEGSDLIPILNDVESVLNKNEPFLTWL
ncbi:WW domain-containing transcription regulator protein 1 isoform X1 [Myripristis murdjan]|uniref:WW domain-containing transcription regulator protein 1 isoform X1 n=1 Tax=Myripristis murdjan TaxID=586833 RepID=UPI0011763A75|nr:WW domain-containing transcription regulator protein 1 isoform X1 [Myripristis murdjan]